MNDAIGLVEVLIATRIDVVVSFFVSIEAADVRRVWVTQMRITVSHPLGDELCNSRAFFDPYCSCRPQVAYFNGLAKYWHRVWCERQESVDGVLDFGIAKHFHEVNCLFHLWIKVVLCEW